MLGITGASGIVYGVRLAEELKKSGVELHTIFTEAAKKTAKYELKEAYQRVKKVSKKIYSEEDIDGAPASGSAGFRFMVVAPCSIRTLGSIANGIADNLLTRAALVQLKERKKLLLIIRETPISTIDIMNMLKVSLAGAIVMPASPGFYSMPETVDDMINFIVGKALDLLDIEHNLYRRWKAEE
ncbi:MAG: UbiX family flavin prenyltransferase [Conexivisphaerales archaeon]|nr:UbiX family flavin prenyltransferase [Conexivisphaerales archaeon]